MIVGLYSSSFVRSMGMVVLPLAPADSTIGNKRRTLP
jgi:hypothetical protein